jgi:glycosyltransferase involved in cell wall biosynthesis
MRRTLESVTAQSIPPALWVIVDDGSSDETPLILAEYTARFDYIKVIRREDRGRRNVGPGVVDAFYTGYNAITSSDFDYLCKLDMDVELPHRYFETLIERMESNLRIGTCSGKPYFPAKRANRLISEKMGDEISGGQSKFYRMECFWAIGGFVREVMWDVIDCHRCRMKGWIACSWDEPQLRYVHLRQVGASQHGLLRGKARHGYGLYFMGTGFLYMLVSTFYRMTMPPLILGGLALFWGYTTSMLSRYPRYNDAEFRRFLRRFHWHCLLHGKAAAINHLHG